MKPTFPIRNVPLPDALFALDPPLSAAWLYVAGDIARAPEERIVAIVGSREAAPESLAFAGQLARAVVESGGIVASGGAKGVDAAAHRGALDAGGRTWVFLGGGIERPYPAEHADLFAEIAASGGALVSIFPPRLHPERHQFHARNRVLIAMSDAVVVVQAKAKSGARNAAKETRRQHRPLFVVPVAPWSEEARGAFAGSMCELDLGARPLTSIRAFLKTLRLARPASRPHVAASSPERGSPADDDPMRSPSETAVARALTDRPQHLDSVVAQTGLATAEVATALLTLALENVVVEGPAGFFRWAKRT